MDDINTEETQASETQEEHIENESSEETTEETQEETEEGQIDYKAELDTLKGVVAKKDEQLNKAGHAIEKAKKEAKESPSVDADEIAQMVEDKVNERMGTVQKTALRTSAETVAGQFTADEDEIKLIMFHYDETIVPTGNLNEDIANAHALANRKKNVELLSEAKRALLNKGNAGSGGGVGQKKKTSTKPSMSPKEQAMVDGAGMKWNGKTGRFEGEKTALKFDEQTRTWESILLSDT